MFVQSVCELVACTDFLLPHWYASRDLSFGNMHTVVYEYITSCVIGSKRKFIPIEPILFCVLHIANYKE